MINHNDRLPRRAMLDEERLAFITNAKQRRAEAVERWASNKELQRSLRMTADEHKAQEDQP
jgi:hypothetical protein